MSLSVLAVSASLAALAVAEVTPTAPGPNETFTAGSNCSIQWDADTSGAWTNMTIGVPDAQSAMLRYLLTARKT